MAKIPLVVFVAILLANLSFVMSQYRRNANLLNIGWIWSMPYDLSNMLRAPLGGPLSLVLSAGLSIGMFFGLAVSPVYYLLGTPSRRYRPKDAVMIPALGVVSGRSESRGLTNTSFMDYGEMANHMHMKYADNDLSETKINEPSYIDHLFRFINEDDEQCRHLMVCHSHGFLSYIPSFALKIFRLFSMKIGEIPESYSAAIQIGFEDQGECAKVFSGCKKSLTDIFTQSFLANVRAIISK